jgi:hypothetical protein
MTTIAKSVSQFRSRFPRGNESQARRFAIEDLFEGDEIDEFLKIWRRAEKIAAETRQAEFSQSAARCFPEEKGN